ncbi:alpha-ketoglutarate-dependent dioxygenase alkB homolog 4 [Scaptodrosophila lebanonensis]|uniref:Alpha-ketoglutarate-dependent dioxygenase alkB homolog 4 n=1 Tax=Drosophila lebanonensis TaxID=7225 RepID=A0A6J2TNE0_DROLE|nr:alpha-ketoglutarate-dependent dioxygenase alkB homolog 4 [Scaptodrosophila lebanonensis]XP_030376649.1 alpha-ketoglutarate-dependent dioxygenase alkB homolog 4 [Scaptodrosophila lebanonensis]
MNTIRPCGCKGVRTCLTCEQDFRIEKPSLQQQFQQLEPWSYCTQCQCLYAGWDVGAVQSQHNAHDKSKGLALPGVLVQEQFLSEHEGAQLMRDLDALPWAVSQSGRRKQNFGPKTNFRKRKLQLGAFTGFPASTQYVQQRFANVPLLHNFQTIEQCSLEYEPSKGASIDPHVDDCWIWGERVVTVNCLGDAVLTLTVYEPQQVSKYNLDQVREYEQSLLAPLLPERELAAYKGKVLRIPMPNLSLIVLYGPARYQFEHAVLREDVRERRVCIAYREFTPMYIDGKDKPQGDGVRAKSMVFWRVPESINVQ